MRRRTILQGITKEMRGIEIAPWFAPLTSKREGFNCLVLDIFDKAELLKRAAADPNIPGDRIPYIEDVDLVGSATEIASLVPVSEHGTFDYIVSSHNFEHLPNPIKFLQGCQIVLKPGGILSMAVPNARGCFDIFRPLTTVIDWLAAFKEGRSKPSAEQIFQQGAYFAAPGQHEVSVTGDLAAHYEQWLKPADGTYLDTHCSVMTPASLELLILECRHLGLISMEAGTVSSESEFYVRLVNREGRSISDINAARTSLMRRILEEKLPKKKWTWRKRVSLNYIRMIVSKLGA
jgi:SAM-dependent methyltransferase